jgi:hypothetical protein
MSWQEIAMRPKERRDCGQKDLFRSRLDQIVDMTHLLTKLAAMIDWGFLEQRFGAVYADVPGRPPLPTRLMAGLAILKHMHNLSDEPYATAGSRTLISSCSAVRRFSNINRPSTAHR